MESPSPEEKNSVFGWLRKVWQYRKVLIVEPLLLCWLLPANLLSVTINNLALEKACRVNLGYDAQVCMSMLDKELYGITCDEPALQIPTDLLVYNETLTELNSTIEIKDAMGTMQPMDFNSTVCKAEIETQKQVTYINAIRGPMSMFPLPFDAPSKSTRDSWKLDAYESIYISKLRGHKRLNTDAASIFPLIVVLFAGGWSDRNRVRKPCMLFPMIGELLAMLGLLITSIFMDVIPMEYGAIIERVVPSMLGGASLLVMGFYSYLTEITDEKDRAFRFGIFSVCASIISIVGQPFSGTLNAQLGYVYMCIIGSVMLLLGILYIIFFIPEVKKKESHVNSDGNINPVFENDGRSIAPMQIDEKQTTPAEEKGKRQKSCLLDFFDPVSVYECAQTLFKKRANNVRFYLIMLIFLQLLIIGSAIGEVDYYYNFLLLQLKWNGEVISYYNTYNSVINIVGTFLMTGVLIKMFKLSDSMGGVIATLGSVISKPIMAFSYTTLWFYIGTTVDICIGFKTIAIKSIISKFVESEELGRIYSCLGIMESLAGFIFTPIYSQLYTYTIESFPGAFYVFSDVFLIPTIFAFIAVYIHLRKQDKKKAKDSSNGVDNPAMEDGKDVEESTRV